VVITAVVGLDILLFTVFDLFRRGDQRCILLSVVCVSRGGDDEDIQTEAIIEATHASVDNAVEDLGFRFQGSKKLVRISRLERPKLNNNNPGTEASRKYDFFLKR
jgi:hypothetical protein